jgi:serine/threonine-protein kinase
MIATRRAMEPERFEKIGKYQIVGKIGQGAMGEVFKAHDPLLNRLVAVKTISGSSPAESDARKRFLREAQSAARLNHPNIITVFELGEEQGRIYMAMELLEGTDLRELINSQSFTDLGQKLDFMDQICDGLAYAHAKQIVHRDLKPGNIHVQPGGQIKVMDFGLARLGASEMTATGTVMGTPNYMSPEQVRGEKADARSDIFSLGAVFYELLTFRKAFDADSIHAVLFQVLDQNPEPVRTLAPDTPEILGQVVHRALEKDPTRRFRDATEMREAVRIARQVIAGEIDEAAGRSAMSDMGSAPATMISPLSESEATIITPPRPPAGSVAKSRSQPASRPTVSRGGRSMTPKPASRPPVPPPPRARASHLPAVAGAGVLAVVLLGGAALWLLRPAPVPPTPMPNATDPVVDALVASLLELARQDLQNKNYTSAVKRADNILNLRKDSVEAEQVRATAQGKLDEVEVAAKEAHDAFEAGNTTLAAQALGKVMSVNPSHPVVDELSQKLNRHFQSKAEEARTEMTRSRTAAEGAGAGRQPDFTEGADGARKAQALYSNKEFAVAAQRYLEARDRFERARNAQDKLRAAPTPRPTAIAVVPTAAPTLPPTQPPITVPTTLAVATPLPTLPPTPRPTPVPQPADEEPAIRRVLEGYERAIESKDLALFKTVKPNLSGSEEKTILDSFRAIRTHEVSLNLGPIQVSGSQATVRVSRQDVLDGRRASFQQTFTLVKGPSGWVIREIGQ